jgi:hypothetical protein
MIVPQCSLSLLKRMRVTTVHFAVFCLFMLTACNNCPIGTLRVQDRCLPFDPVRGLCVPICEGRSCGDDGCGGSCGVCDGGTPNCVLGQCVAECTASCDGRSCGDDGCGGTCGSCPDGGACTGSGQCIPKAFSCEARYYADGAVCDCDCGAADPDCEDTSLDVVGCELRGATCDAASACVGGGTWTCDELRYDDGLQCDCNCGVPDPDCKNDAFVIAGCSTGEICSAAGVCEPLCTPSCDGKACGNNGCGGSCGDCSAPTPFCNLGTCGATCVPSCDGRVCGDDDCGGSCGSCAVSESCVGGTCAPLPNELTCAGGRCGGNAPGGCSCAASCLSGGAPCCADAEAVCGCFPKCTDKACGDDGCGGSCGSCDAGERCSATQVCVPDLCAPDPCNGHGACSPSAGACSCSVGYDGISCDVCASGYVGYPTCVASLCDVTSCNGHGDCDPLSGDCTCATGFTGLACESCSGVGVYPSCE